MYFKTAIRRNVSDSLAVNFEKRERRSAAEDSDDELLAQLM